MGVLLVDLDQFKRVNDTYGHATGDAVLAEATSRMQANTREYDSIGRYGREEFSVILPGCDEKSTFTQAMRMCTALASRRIITRDQQLRVTASFGATSISPGMLFMPERIIRQVDAALYRAKEHGRNRVEYIAIDEQAAKHSTDERTLA